MSIFDAYSKGEIREIYRAFLALPKGDYKHQIGFNQTGAKGKRYPEKAMRLLEQLVNEKAARAEAHDTSIGERYRIARDYKGLSDAQVAREMGVSRELSRRWGADINMASVQIGAGTNFRCMQLPGARASRLPTRTSCSNTSAFSRWTPSPSRRPAG